MNGADDPGWRPALRPIWTFLVPWVAFFPPRRRLDLIGLRRLFLHTGVALIELTFVISSLADEHHRGAAWAWVLLGVGTAGCVGGLVWSTSRWRDPHDPADLISPEKVANGFRALSLIRLGFAASPA